VVERVALYWGSAPTVCDGTSRQPRVGVATRPPVTFRVVDAAAEVALEPHPRTPWGEIERLREPPTSAAAESSLRRTSARFVDSSRPGGPCPGEPP